jgi:tetratricopeptide (TPR) repeat protein
MVIRLIQEKTWGKRALWGFGLILFVPTLYFTSSRTGLLAGIIGIYITLALLYVPNLYSKIRWRERKSLREIIPPRFIFFALFTIIVLLGFVVFFLIQSQRISTHAPTLISARSSIWGPAVEIIQKSPLLGHGPGSFSVFFAQENKIPPGFATSHAHNILLQIAVETGLIGVGLVIWIIVGSLVMFLRTWRTSSPEVRPRLAAYAGAGIAMLSHHSLDYLFESPLYALSAFILFALALKESPASERRSARGGRAILVPVTILLFFLVGSVYISVGSSNYWDGNTAGRNGDWETATAEICYTYEKRPEISLYGFQCSLALAQLYYRTEDPNDLQDSLRIQREAIERDPYWPIHWANLAVLEWENGEFDSALINMQNALDLAPMNPTIAINLAWMEGVRGNQEAAITASFQALNADPWLQFDTAFETSPVAKEALERFRHEENHDAPWFLAVQGWKSLMDDQWTIARDTFLETIQNNPTEGLAYAGLGYAYLQLGQGKEVNTNIDIATFMKSSSLLVLHTAGAIAQQQGQNEDALQYFQSAFDQIENMSYSSSFYNRTYYRFFLPSDLVPQMRRGGLTAEMFDSLQLLAQHYDENGEPELALEIRKRIYVETERSMP